MAGDGRDFAGRAKTWHELIVEAAPTAMIAVDEEGRIVLVNAAAERLFGYGREELLGASIEKLVPERFRPQHSGDREAFLATPRAQLMGRGRDLFARRKDGSEVPVEIGLNPLRTEEGTFVLSVVIDITERRRAEDRFRLAVEAAPNAMIMSDRDGHIVLVNSQTERLFGYGRQELIGKPVEVLVPDRFKPGHPADRDGFFRAPQSRAMGAGRDLFGLCKDGREVPVEIGLNPIAMPEGDYVLSSVIDITERKRTEAEREELLERERAALAEARAASQAKDDFLATLSHEMRTPLNAILGWASHLAVGGSTAEELQIGLETIERNAQHQARIIAEVLDVSRIIRGRFRLDLERCDPAALITSVLGSLGPAARAKKLSVCTALEPVNEIVADPGRLEQVVWNLVSNAIKFTPRGGRIDVELADVGSHIRLRVCDTGVGISPQFLARAFERFSQSNTSSTREHGGLGLGLAIVRHLIELHGGTVAAESEGQGRGSTFTVRLPFTPPDTSGWTWAHSEVRGFGIGHESAQLSDLRVVLVDDEPDTLDVLRRALERFGAKVETASSVDDAVELLRESDPDVVVTDIAMPGQDGFALLRWLNQRWANAGRRVPVIALTAYAGSEDRQKALAAGFDLHVPKPVEPSRLASLLADVTRDHARTPVG